jgi:hypothetical protein
MLTKQQIDKLAQPITNHVITKWRVEGNSLILINAIGQKFTVPLTNQVDDETQHNGAGLAPAHLVPRPSEIPNKPPARTSPHAKNKRPGPGDM